MTSRNLLIIAAVPGFRSNTKLEREDNNAPRQKQVILDLYADLVLAPKRKAAKHPAMSAPYGVFDESSDFRRLSSREFFEQQYLTSSNNGTVSADNKTVFYEGRWYTAMEARNSLPRHVYESLAKCVEAHMRNQPKPPLEARS